ncbi:MAG: hypothetical protein KDB82_01190 [Planctomycetes bacterium]|nr:hypothetical protein [Planctomycetota bacterium]
METALYWIAGITTGLFVIRLVLMFIGLDGSGAADAADALHGADAMDALDSGDPTDVLHAHDAADIADFKVFTILTAIVTLMVGSWMSLLFLSMSIAPWISLLGGFGVGFVAALGVGYAIFSMRKLEHDGTIRQFEAEGLKGTCYVKIPEAGQGKGQVQVTVKGRLLTFDAISDGPEIPSFKPVVVMTRIDEKTLRVCPTE